MKRRKLIAIVLALALVPSVGLAAMAVWEPPKAPAEPKTQEELDRPALSDDPRDQAAWKREKDVAEIQKVLNELRGEDAVEQPGDRAAIEGILDDAREQGHELGWGQVAAMVIMPTPEEIEADRAELFPETAQETGLTCPACGKDAMTSDYRYDPLVESEGSTRECWHGSYSLMNHTEYDRTGDRADHCNACGYQQTASISEHLRYCPFRGMIF